MVADWVAWDPAMVCGKPSLVDIEASLAHVDAQYANPTITKLPQDLDRYRAVIAADRPEVVVECGTQFGGSACWFAALGVDVVTVDIAPQADAAKSCSDRITWVVGNSADPSVAGMVRGFAEGHRVMVVLDSDHSAKHVAAEIRLYGPLVTPGCHLVVEDGICRWLPLFNQSGSPLDAVEELLAGNPDWIRDEAVEALSPVSMFPGGWWTRA
jgi:cephalosporin hydroxylase